MVRKAEDILEKFQGKENDKKDKKGDVTTNKWKKQNGKDPEDYLSLQDQISSEVEEAYWLKKAYQTRLMEINSSERRK